MCDPMNLALDLHIARNRQAYYVGSMQQHQPLIDLDINIMLKCTQSAVKVALVYPYPNQLCACTQRMINLKSLCRACELSNIKQDSCAIYTFDKTRSAICFCCTIDVISVFVWHKNRRRNTLKLSKTKKSASLTKGKC